MDMTAFVILIIGIGGYFLSKRKPIFLLVTGFGGGLLTGAIWATAIVSNTFR